MQMLEPSIGKRWQCWLSLMWGDQSRPPREEKIRAKAVKRNQRSNSQGFKLEQAWCVDRMNSQEAAGARAE